MRAMHRMRALALSAALLAPATSRTLPAQLPDSLLPRARPIRAWEVGALVGGGLVAIAVLDRPVRDWIQDPANRNNTTDDIASAARHFGQVEVVAPVAGGLILTGLIANNRPVLNAGLRVTAAVGVSTVLTQALKYSLGRKRPRDTDDVWDFNPFSGSDAMPSGHTATAFTLATVLAQEINNPWATAGLYVLAAGTAWSRVYDNAHWTADVLTGAAIGYASAKLATGRWTIFGLRAPVPLASDGRVGLMWSGSF